MHLSVDQGRSMIESSVPKRFRDAKKPVKVSGMTWMQSFYLSGGVGVGKTHNAYGLFKWRIENAIAKLKNESYFWLPYLKIINVPHMISQARRSTIEDRQMMIESLIDISMLILDDLGGEYRTDYSEQMLYDIVEGRYNQMLYTGFISNLELGDELPYEVRILSRIRGIIGDNDGVLEGKDRRIPE